MGGDGSTRAYTPTIPLAPPTARVEPRAPTARHLTSTPAPSGEISHSASATPPSTLHICTCEVMVPASRRVAAPTPANATALMPLLARKVACSSPVDAEYTIAFLLIAPTAKSLRAGGDERSLIAAGSSFTDGESVWLVRGKARRRTCRHLTWRSKSRYPPHRAPAATHPSTGPAALRQTAAFSSFVVPACRT